jgi:hypothetical protein
MVEFFYFTQNNTAFKLLLFLYSFVFQYQDLILYVILFHLFQQDASATSNCVGLVDYILKFKRS